MFLYPGQGRILPSIRLANIRDGEEDWECLHIAELKAGRDAVERIVRTAVRSKQDFSRSYTDLQAVRRRIFDLVDEQ